METTSFEPGDVVYLATEMEAGGRIHEIGAQAVVRAVSGAILELALGGTAAETAHCRAHHVVRADERRARRRAPTGRWSFRLGAVPG